MRSHTQHLQNIIENHLQTSKNTYIYVIKHICMYMAICTILFQPTMLSLDAFYISMLIIVVSTNMINGQNDVAKLVI